uniref:Wound-induced basic protein n=1 Tax=Rhizophora mucronata TaxID=61149 RepID=A0A2P2IIA1_RHIMU
MNNYSRHGTQTKYHPIETFHKAFILRWIFKKDLPLTNSKSIHVKTGSYFKIQNHIPVIGSVVTI